MYKLNYKSVKAPELTRAEIAKAAYLFRQKHRPEKPSPLDVMRILEIDLRIRIIPSPGLEVPANTNALISADWKNLIIDLNQYMDERYDRRTNFSVAHELGHFVLHKDLYEQLEINDIKAFYRFFSEVPEETYQQIEYQANEFAGNLMVPTKELSDAVQEITEKVKSREISPFAISEFMCNRFGVSGEVVIIRIAKEKIKIDGDLIQHFQ